MTLSTPVALVFLLVIPFIAYLGWPRQRYRRVRDSLSLALRVSIITLLVLALAGVQIVQSANRLAVVFLVDVSDSMGAVSQEEALNFVRDSLDGMAVDDVAGVILFGADAQVARSISNTRELGQIRVEPATSNTNLAEAVRLGLALFPGDAARRMVLLSDGQPTIGDTQAAAQLALAAGVEVSYVPFFTGRGPEVQVQDFHAPAVIGENQLFDLTVTISSEVDAPATVTVLAAGQVVHTEPIDLREGTNNYTLTLMSGEAGFRDFFVRVEPEGNDGFYQNNNLGAFTRVEGDPRVLLVGKDDAEIAYLLPALEESGLNVDYLPVDRMPIGVAPLTQYDSVILANLSALDLGQSRMEAIETYVGDLGGGLVVVGGPSSYGPGGYFQTPIEDALPVEMQITDQERLPSLTIAYLIDRSGSMGAVSPRGIPNIELAKAAIIRSIEFLQERDRAAVGSFDFDAYWVAEFQNVDNAQALAGLVATLRPSGGTNIRSGMRLVARDIVNEPSDLRHIILLTDGGADSNGLVEMARDLYDNQNVTTSVISIGVQEAPFLADMAEAGQGNYHHVIDADNIPAIFTLETVLATRSYIVEDPFTPIATSINASTLHPIIRGINALPELQGYIATTSRPTAQTILRGSEPFNDPILAAWQYGLGRSVAFTSDATARWASNWVTWDDYVTFWNQTIRWTMTEGVNTNLETQIIMEDEQARIVVDARNSDGTFWNGLNLESRVVYDPEQPATRVQLRQVAPGRYEGTFIPGGEGAHFIRINQVGADGQATADADDAPVLSQTTGWVMTYSPEYQIRQSNDTLLAEVADLTGGVSLAGVPDQVFTHDIDAASVRSPIWQWLLLIAMLLLPFDIAVRRLIITRSDLRRLSAYLSARFRPEANEEATARRMSSLRQARDRAREGIDDRVIRPNESVTSATESSSSSDTPKPAEVLKPRYSRAPSAVSKPKADTDAAETNIGSRLLKRRQNRENEE
ncbi:MAG: VWA domain-containing protein [Aggregatilineales bacterium]